jgi:L-rhamnose mutarotase
MNIQRFGSVIGLKPKWNRVIANCTVRLGHYYRALKQSNIRNYSIYIAEIEGKKYLFSYLEYVGDDYEADMKAIADDPQTRLWWQETDPCQIPLPKPRQRSMDCAGVRVFHGSNWRFSSYAKSSKPFARQLAQSRNPTNH